MMGYVLLACFALLSGIEAIHISDNHQIRYHEIPDSLDSEKGCIFFKSYSPPLWATTGGSSDGQKITVICGTKILRLKDAFTYYIHTYEQNRQPHKSCKIFNNRQYKLKTLIGTDEASDDEPETLVFVATTLPNLKFYDHFSDGEYHIPKDVIVTIDREKPFDDCYPHEVFSTYGLINAVKTLDEKNIFDVVVKKNNDSTTTCGNDDDCGIRILDLTTRKVSEAKPFVVNLNWTGLKFERLNDEELLVYGMNNHEFKWLKFDRLTGKSSELLSLLGFSGKEIILHSGLTFCWINNQGVDRTVDCSRLDTEVAAPKTVFFKKSVHLLFVHATTRNEILLVTGTLNKKSEDNSEEMDQWSYNATKIREDGSFTKPLDLPLRCLNPPSFSNTKYDGDVNEVSFQYVCKQNDGFYHNEISIGMDDD